MIALACVTIPNCRVNNDTPITAEAPPPAAYISPDTPLLLERSAEARVIHICISSLSQPSIKRSKKRSGAVATVLQSPFDCPPKRTQQLRSTITESVSCRRVLGAFC